MIGGAVLLLATVAWVVLVLSQPLIPNTGGSGVHATSTDETLLDRDSGDAGDIDR